MSAHLITLAAGPSRVCLAPDAGGAIVGFEWNSQPILRPTSGDAVAASAVRQFACYPLVPFSNRIARASLHWQSRTYPLTRYIPEEPHAIHGNGWQRAWAVHDRGPAHAVLELEHNAIGDAALEWPFPYRARQRIALDADSLTLALEIENIGDTVFPFGLGWHPYFPRDVSTELGFTARGMWRTDATQLPTRFDTTHDGADFHIARPIGDATLDHCFAGWIPPAVVAWPERGICAEITADAVCDHLVVFIPPGRDFAAIEPATHMTDAFNRAQSGNPVANAAYCTATGSRVLVPGGRFSCTMRISVSRIVAR